MNKIQKNLDKRAKKIIGYKQCQKKQVNLVNTWKQRICSFVHKVVMGEVDDPSENYFEFLNTAANGIRTIAPWLGLAFELDVGLGIEVGSNLFGGKLS